MAPFGAHRRYSLDDVNIWQFVIKAASSRVVATHYITRPSDGKPARFSIGTLFFVRYFMRSRIKFTPLDP